MKTYQSTHTHTNSHVSNLSSLPSAQSGRSSHLFDPEMHFPSKQIKSPKAQLLKGIPVSNGKDAFFKKKMISLDSFHVGNWKMIAVVVF